MLVECFKKLVFAVFKCRVERFAVERPIIFIEKAYVAETSAYFPIHFYTTNDKFDPFDFEYPVDSREGLCGREVYAINGVQVQNEEVYWTTLEFFLQHVSNVFLDTNNSAKEQIPGQLHDMRLLPRAVQESMLDGMSPDGRIRNASW